MSQIGAAAGFSDAPGAQLSADWFEVRLGKLTASKTGKALGRLKNGERTAEARSVIIELLAERLTGAAVDHVVTADIRWGTETQPAARDWYMVETGNFVVECGFVPHPAIGDCGASPDGIVPPDGLVEYKCPRTTTHLRWLEAGIVPPEHIPQMQLQLACTGRAWCDFVSFDPRLPPSVQGFVRRYVPAPGELDRLEEDIRHFLKEVDDMFDRLTGVKK
jgi:hypothetical protein